MFPTFELSDPRFEVDGLRWVTVKSPSLGGRADITLFVPSEVQGKENVPIVLLLHGVYGSHWAWALKGGAHRTTQRMIREGQLPPMVLAMPSDGLWGDGSGYVPHLSQDYEKWIVEEVPAAVQQAVPETSQKSPRFLTGLSMGGFGALRITGKHPTRFQAASGHSSATEASQFLRFSNQIQTHWSNAPFDQSVLEALKQGAGQLPPVRFDCGTEDLLLEANRELHCGLQAAGVPHEYSEFPGGHTWDYWERHLEDSLRFFAKHLG
jgi:putative tributyrin esterase